MSFINKTIDSYERNSRLRTALFIVLVLACVCCSLFMNRYTPTISDDYYYMMYGGERITSFSQIFSQLYEDYFDYNARVPAHFFAMTFLMLDKGIFNVVNSLMYTGFTLLVYTYCKTKKGVKPILYLWVLCALWYFERVAGQTTLWLTGSCNYLWGAFAVLLFMLPYRNLLVRGLAGQPANSDRGTFAKVMFCVGFFLFAIIAGWQNENVSPLGIAFGIMIFVLLRRKKIRLPAWFFVGLAGELVGIAFLLLSPSSRAKTAVVKQTGIYEKFIHPLLSATHNFNYLLVPLLVFVCVFVYLWSQKRLAGTALANCMFLCSLMSNYAMAASPYYPLRAMFAATALLIIADFLLLSKLNFGGFKPVIAVLSLLIAFSCAVNFVYVSNNIRRCYTLHEQRTEQALEFSREHPDEIFETYRILAMYDHVPVYGGIEDMLYDENSFMNRLFSQVYGIKGIRSVTSIE